MANIASRQTERAGRSPGLSLLVIATAQLMLVLDDTIANVALPSIQRELAVSAGTLPWIINAYILAFGGLLLFGGRVGDLYGRRRVFRIGLGLFTLASVICGLALNTEVLVGARGLQGIGAALAAPNALALIATTFPVGKERNSAMAVYGAMSALGITIGVLLGGVLTGLLGWRWVFLINLPVGLAVLAGTGTLIEGERHTGKLDAPGAATGASAMVALVYGITRAGEHGWNDAVTLGALVIALALAGLFLWLQAYREHPMLPLGLFRGGNRSGSYATMLFVGAGLMGTFYLISLFMQQVLQFSPIWAGVASLPFSAGIIVGAGGSSKLVERFAPRAVAGPGLLLGAVGMLWLSTLAADSSYFAHVLPAVFITSAGLGMAAVTMTLTAVHGVPDERAGIASALVNSSQQVGAALGLAVFTTVSTLVANGLLPQAIGSLTASNAVLASQAQDALAHGYGMAFLTGTGMLLIAGVIVFASITTKRTQSAAAPGA